MIPPPRSASRRDDEATELRNRCIGIETIHEFATCNPVSATIRRRACVAASCMDVFDGGPSQERRPCDPPLPQETRALEHLYIQIIVPEFFNRHARPSLTRQSPILNRGAAVVCLWEPSRYIEAGSVSRRGVTPNVRSRYVYSAS